MIVTYSFGNENDEKMNKNNEFQRRAILNTILESKLYKSNGSPQDNFKEHSLSLNDINAQLYNFDYPRKHDDDVDMDE